MKEKKNTVLAAIIISWLLNSFTFSADNQGKFIDCSGSYVNVDALVYCANAVPKYSYSSFPFLSHPFLSLYFLHHDFLLSWKLRSWSLSQKPLCIKLKHKDDVGIMNPHLHQHLYSDLLGYKLARSSSILNRYSPSKLQLLQLWSLVVFLGVAGKVPWLYRLYWFVLLAVHDVSLGHCESTKHKWGF